MNLSRIVVTLCLGLAWAVTATARVQETCTYTKPQVFQSALRFIRVDNGYPVAEKDEGAGYVLFEYPTGNGPETTPASFEIIELESEVQLVVRIPKLPEQHERLLVRRFFDKLRSEYGDPPVRKPPPRVAPSKDESDEDEPNEDKPEDDKDADERAPKSPPPRAKVRHE